jgi:hypothetical protein
LALNFYDLGGGTDFQLNVDVWQAAHVKRNTFAFYNAEATRTHCKPVSARGKTRKTVKACGIRFCLLGAERWAPNLHGRADYYCSRLVFHVSLNSRGCFLR